MSGKRYKEAKEKIESNSYPVEDAIGKLKELATADFDETVEIAVNLGVDPRKSDQMVRGSVVLPHGTGRNIKVAAAVDSKLADKAQKAGADIAGIEKVTEVTEKGDIDFDVLLATPDCMKNLGKLGRILGPKGLMPSPKSGTVVEDIEEAIKKVKKGQVEFKIGRSAVLHGILGKISFSQEDLLDNYNAYIQAVKDSRPNSAKGKFIEKVFLSTTMGPSLKLDI
ncbi:MAG: 50S ribosomal protein L1 [Elusimicrobiota bacterium]